MNIHTYIYMSYIYIRVCVSIYVRVHIFVCYFLPISSSQIWMEQKGYRNIFEHLRVDPENPVSSSFNKIIIFPGYRLQHQEKI